MVPFFLAGIDERGDEMRNCWETGSLGSGASGIRVGRHPATDGNERLRDGLATDLRQS
jgi:hypothetical protein